MNPARSLSISTRSTASQCESKQVLAQVPRENIFSANLTASKTVPQVSGDSTPSSTALTAPVDSKETSLQSPTICGPPWPSLFVHLLLLPPHSLLSLPLSRVPVLLFIRTWSNTVSACTILRLQYALLQCNFLLLGSEPKACFLLQRHFPFLGG